MPGIEPGAFHMQSERSTTELHPLRNESVIKIEEYFASLSNSSSFSIKLITSCK